MNTIAEMGIWVRGCSRSATILKQYRRRHNWPFNVSAPTSLLHVRKFPQQGEANILPLLHSYSDAPFFFTRSYAALAKAKKEEGNKVEAKQTADDPDGPRINKAITSDPVRLVTDDGHQILSRREALDYARKLKLDLVEVQRHAKPAVCKVMDYNKEKYKQQQREKERSKNKLDLTVRTGECREVRFTAKTEQKDLERKAEMAKRLMDRGYRVKCMAMGIEGQNLEELLLRLATLIEDVSIVESGPKAEKRNAWMIVRHTKFGGTKKKGAQQTPKTVERTKGETIKDNLKKTVESKSNKEDSVISPKEQSKEEIVQFEESASFEQFGEHETELAPFEESASFKQFGENEVEFTPFEESACFEQFGEHETELVPSIEKVEETFTAIVHSTNKMKMPATKPDKQEEFMAVDKQEEFMAVETEPESGDSNAEIFINQRMQNLAGTHPIMQGHLASNTGKSPMHDNFLVKKKGEGASIVHSMDVPLRNFDSPTNEIVRQVRPLSNKLSFGQVKPEQFGTSDVKQVVSVPDSRQAAVGRSQRHSASNIGRLASVDSVPKGISGSLKAKVNDFPSNCPSNVSVPLEEASNNGKQLQNSHLNLNNDPAMQDHQDMPIAGSHISGDVSRHALVGRNFGDRGTNTSKNGKKSSVDSVPKQTNVSEGSDWGIFGQAMSKVVSVNSAASTETEIGVANVKHSGPIVHSIDAPLRNLDSPTSEIVKQVQPLSDNLNFGQVKPEQLGTSDVKQVASVYDFRQVAVGRSEGHSASKIGKLASIDSAPKWASGSFKADVKGVPSNCPSNVSVACEQASNIGEQLQNSAINLNNDPALQDQQEMPVPSAQIFGDDEQEMPISSSHISGDVSRHDLFSRSFGDQGTNTSETGKQYSVDSVLKTIHVSEGSRWGVFGQPKSPSVNVNNAAPAETEIGVANRKHSGSSDYSREVLAGVGSSPLGISTSNKEKQKPLDLIPNRANDSAVFMSDNSKEVSPLSIQASNNGMSRDPSRISISNSRDSGDGGPNEHSREVLAGIGSSAIGYSAYNKGKQTPLDSTPKLVNDSGVSISGTSKEVPPLSVQESSNSMSRDPSRISDSKSPVPGYGKSQSPTDSSSSNEGNHASVTGKQASTSGGSRWGIFSAPRNAVVESPSHPTGVTKDQTEKVSTPRSVVESPSHPAGVRANKIKKDQPYSSEEENISASGKVGTSVNPRYLHPQNRRHVPIGSFGTTQQVAKQAIKETPDSKKDQLYSSEGQNIDASSNDGNNAAPSHLHPQNQRHVPVGSVGTANQVAKQAPKETPSEIGKPTHSRWGIFSMRAPSKPADAKEKP